MNKLVRLLVMFGPMIYRGVTKMMNKRKRQQSQAPLAPPSDHKGRNDQHNDAPQEKEGTYNEDDIVEEQ